mgnify:CR=1 FL=1|tara:strand:- start:98 stop:2329 length:2232 start_codon:yes stop_codon:yes gene_type:complete
MPKQTVTLRDFSGGLNSQRDKRDIADNESSFCQDVIGDQVGVLRTMGHGEGTPRDINLSSTTSFATVDNHDISGAGGYGLKHFEFDYNKAKSNSGEHYICAIDDTGNSSNTQCKVLDYTNETWTDIGDISGAGVTTCQGAVIPIGNKIILHDTTVNNSSTVKQYGYVGNKQLGLAQDSFFFTDFKISEPTAGNNVTSSTQTTGSFNVQITQGAAGSGRWQAAYYKFGLSYIYEKKMESTVFEMALAENVTNDDCLLNITVYADSDSGLSSNLGQDYPRNVTGGRLYWKFYDNTGSRLSDGEWNLLCDIDLTGVANQNNAYGIRSKMTGHYTNWTISNGASTPHGTATVTATEPSIDTYATINGYSSNDGNLTIGEAGDGFKTGVFANRRLFVANVQKTTNEGVQRKHADRIMYSPVNKENIFPNSNFIDVALGDAEAYIKLESVGDRLFAYKTNTLYIINIGSPNPGGWFLEATHKGYGVLHPSAVMKTPFGITWVNQNGLYVYEGGSGITELVGEKFLNGYKAGLFNLNSWGKTITAGSIIGYYAKESHIIVALDSRSTTNNTNFGGNGSDVIIYDLKTRSIWLGKNRLKSGEVFSNFDYDANGDLLYYSEDGSGTITLRAWDGEPQNSSNISYQTKDFDFNTPSKRKKIYGFYVTYKSTATSIANALSYAINGSTTYATTNLTNNTLDVASDFEIAEITLSSPVECQSLSVKISSIGEATQLLINDISIEYRTLYKNLEST